MDPRIGPLLSASFDEAAERALIARARRTGYDVRAVDAVAIGWSEHGATYLARAAFDVVAVTDRLWERLLSPRQRGRDPSGDVRVEGMLGRTPVALLVLPQCREAGYAEGVTRTVDRLLGGGNLQDPSDALLVWRSEQMPSEVALAAGTALAQQVRSIELRVTRRDAGVAVALRLEGTLDAQARSRVRSALDALIEAPIGELSGAADWLGGASVVEESGTAVEVRATVPWRALVALAQALRGDVGRASFR